MSSSATLSDAIAILSLTEPRSEIDHSLKYNDRQQQFLQPVNSGGYSQSVNFDTQTIVGQWADFSQGYLSLPLTISTSATMLASPVFPTLAFKSSALSAISRIVVRTEGGGVLVDEQNTGAFADHLRLAFEKDQDWLKLVAPTIHYARDRCSDGIVGLNNAKLLANPSISKHRTAPTEGKANDEGSHLYEGYNAGFHERQGMLMRECFTSKGDYPGLYQAPLVAPQMISCVLNIPLRVMHDFFKQLSFPITNCRLQFEFYLANRASGSFRALTLGSTIPVALGSNQTQVAGGDVDIAITPGQDPRLYYHNVSLQPQDAIEMFKKLANGYQKKVSWRRYQLIKGGVGQVGVADSTEFPQPITQGSNACKRLWIMCYPTGLIDGHSWPSVLATGANGFKKLQVKCNGTNLYNNPLNTLPEQYSELRQAMRMGGDGDPTALLPYQDFKLVSRIHCIDLSRSAYRASDPNAPMAITVEFTVDAPQPVDIVYLLESEYTAVMDFSSHKTTITVGSTVVAL